VKLKSIVVLLIAFVASLFIAGCGGSGRAPDAKDSAAPESNAKEPLFAYVGANLKDPVSELAAMYEQKTGVKVDMTLNNSGALINQLETMKKGDIFMPGGMPYVEKAKQAGLLTEVIGPIALHTPVIVTPKGNPAGIKTIQDLTKPDVKLVMPDKEATAIGKTAFSIFNKLGIARAVEGNVLTYVETPAKVLSTLSMGQGNAGIVEYSNTLKVRDKLDMVEIDPSVNIVEEIPVALVAYSNQKEQARSFMEFVKKEGPAVFEKYGFKTKK
jgi:molybdate transport system substrate-binding protein